MTEFSAKSILKNIEVDKSTNNYELVQSISNEPKTGAEGQATFNSWGFEYLEDAIRVSNDITSEMDGNPKDNYTMEQFRGKIDRNKTTYLTIKLTKW